MHPFSVAAGDTTIVLNAAATVPANAASAAPGEQREAESRNGESCHPRVSLWKSP